MEGTTPTPISYYNVAAAGVAQPSLCNAKFKNSRLIAFLPVFPALLTKAWHPYWDLLILIAV